MSDDISDTERDGDDGEEVLHRLPTQADQQAANRLRWAMLKKLFERNEEKKHAPPLL